MQKLEIDLKHKKYPIYIGKGLFKDAGSFLGKIIDGRRAIIITDSNLYPSYGLELYGMLKANRNETEIYTIPAGENSKSLNELSNLYSSFAGFGITRNDYIIALGGGVTGDLAGFAASTWLRGTGFIQIPSSLLAMVDSSIGGKVAVNLPAGKNLVGSFYHPEAVLIDPLLLETLPDRHFADGMAEIIKYGCIEGEALFKRLENLKDRRNIMEYIEDIIYSCCDIKHLIVEEDEHERNLRMILNFGHTIGHAIEKYYGYEKYTHGEAVSIGMVFIAGLSQKLGYCGNNIKDRLRSLLSQFGLPVEFPDLEPETFLEAVFVDKKARTNDIYLILIKEIGNLIIEKFSKERIGGLIHEELIN